ncbi:hypothetical protein BHE90_000172 [Fusarium euwallaceae]|uniref:G domain-containing protein n=1 Tax=Fusarium euwallaceae TaxID=1147111 RepID=A0A430MBF0_9HYPO|nr:hypothetical protein BHE90_000172 [Fusarium euwallaceae]
MLSWIIILFFLWGLWAYRGRQDEETILNLSQLADPKQFRATLEDEAEDEVRPHIDGDEPTPERKAELDTAAKAAAQADIKYVHVQSNENLFNKARGEPIIAIMGLTGTGKSTFIKLLTSSDVKIGHNLAACTADVGIYALDTAGGHSVALIDTPGFDDTYRSDTEVLTDVAYFLAQVYSNNLKLAGIIYLHRILDNRMTGSALKNLHMFQALCGKKSDMSHVVLATSMWDRLDGDQSDGIAREDELRSTYWADMLECGSQMFRHDNSRESAQRIINHILSLSGNMVLEIQHEIVVEARPLNKTQAGEELLKDLLAEREKHEKDLADVKKSHEEAMRSGSEQMTAILAKKEREHQEKLEQMDRDREERMKALERDYAKMQQDQQLKWQRAAEDLERKEKELEKKVRQEKAQVQALQNMQDVFDATIKDMQHDHEKRDADREAKVKQERGLNQLQITALEARITQYEKDAADLASRKNRPAVIPAIQALAGAGALVAGFTSGNTAMVASGTGLLTTAGSAL